MDNLKIEIELTPEINQKLDEIGTSIILDEVHLAVYYARLKHKMALNGIKAEEAGRRLRKIFNKYKNTRRNNMSKREEFKAALKEFYAPNWEDVFKAYERIHPPEFKPGDYVTGLTDDYVSIGVIASIKDGLAYTKSKCFWKLSIIKHSTPEEIAVYNKRINDEIYT